MKNAIAKKIFPKAKHLTLEDIIITIVNTTLLIILAFMTFVPFLHEINVSLSSSAGVSTGSILLLPRDFTLEAYAVVFETGHIIRPYLNSIFVMLADVCLSLLLTGMMAYGLSKRDMPLSKVIMYGVVFTMLFNAGIIPSYLWIRDLGLIDSLWVLILPGMVIPYNLIVMKNFFNAIPPSLEESAYIDGANPIVIFFKIIVPLSKPVIATVSLWLAVGSWNNFMGPLLYINDRDYYTLPLVLREVINGQIQAIENAEQIATTSSTSVIAATVIASVLPILCVYPFVQKYFVKGVMIGSVKG